VQQLVNRSGWASGNAMAFYLTGTGTREVESYDGEPGAAAALFVTYATTAQEDSAANRALADSLLAVANALVDTDYTVPSWTLLLRARKTVSVAIDSNTIDSAAIAGLSNTLAKLEPKGKPYGVNVVFNGDPTSRAGFAWYTNQNVTGGMVQVVQGNTNDTAAFASPAVTVNAASRALTDVNYNVSGNALNQLAGIPDNSKRSYTSNKATVTGLTANTAYSYRVGKAGAWSGIGHFTTAAAGKGPFTFVYFTDPQANTDDMFAVSAKTMHKAMSMYPSANFLLSCGDLIETSGSTNSEWEYEQFFATQQDIWYNAVFAPIIGNHDKSANKNYTYHFNTPVVSFDSVMSTTPGSVYSFVYGDALFMALSYEDYGVAGYLDSLKNWMKATVAANQSAKWKIVFFHKTMYTGSRSHQSDADGKTVRETMGPLFDSLKIDLALQGHDHIYEVMGPIKNGALVADAVTNRTVVTPDARANVTGYLGGTFDVADGTLYFLNNSAGKKKYEPRSRQQMDSAETAINVTNYFGLFTGRFGQTGEPTFSNIRVSTDSINVSTYTVSETGDATLFDAFKVVKEDAVGMRPSLQPGASLRNLSVRINRNTHVLSIVRAHGNDAVRLSAFNCAGKNVMNKVSTSRVTIVPLGSLPAGQYFLKISAGAEKTQIKLPNF